MGKISEHIHCNNGVVKYLSRKGLSFKEARVCPYPKYRDKARNWDG